MTIGEIDTGDTMFFVEGGWEERKAAELAAVTRIFAMLPAQEGKDLLALWQEFRGRPKRGGPIRTCG